jgi:cytoskeletal protein CcmA (bactofilin family)
MAAAIALRGHAARSPARLRGRNPITAFVSGGRRSKALWRQFREPRREYALLSGTATGGIMESVAQIGPSIRIKGQIFAQEPLTIAGHVTGTIDVTGHPLVVTDSGHIAADIVAHTIVIGGSVNGKVLADGRIVVNKTATFEGDLSAPAVSVHDGALVQGRLEIAGRR